MSPRPVRFTTASVSLALALGSGCPLAAQTNWFPVTVATSPPAYVGATSTFDPARGVVVLFGGYLRATNSYHADTWTFDGVNWTQASQTGPSPRADAALAYDATRNRTVLFGGQLNSVSFGDTWEWNGQAWTLQSPAQSPPPRHHHGLAYDPARGRVVLFGGNQDGTTILGDTWEWDGATWTQATSPAPSARMRLALVADSARGALLLFGGTRSSSGPILNDTWVRTGTQWSLRVPGTSPSPRFSCFAGDDSARGRVVLFGGDASLFPDTWEWDGTDWTQQPTSQTPGNRSGVTAAFDSVRRSLILFGGDRGAVAQTDTWSYSAIAGFTPFGQGCAGRAGTPLLAAAGGSLPRLGQLFTITLSNLPGGPPAVLSIGVSRTRLGSLPLPLDLSVIGMPGCLLYQSLDVLTPLVTFNGTATWSLALPPTFFGLVGESVVVQGLAPDPTANSLGWIVSNAAELRVGR